MLAVLLAFFQDPALEPGPCFGTSACFVADWDGDGRADLAVGNPRPEGGAVLVYSTKELRPVDVLRSKDGSADFGEAVVEVADASARPVLAVADARRESSRKFARIVFVTRSGEPIRSVELGEVPDKWPRNVRFDRLGDIDADGAEDLVAAYRDRVHAVSSKTGRILWSRSTLARFEPGYGLLGDLDGDGLRDVGFASSSGVTVVSACGGATLLEIPSDHGWVARSVGPLPDLDGDGREDIVVGAPRQRNVAITGGRVSAHSSATGKLLWQWECDRYDARLGNSVQALSDVDRDGRADIVVSRRNFAAFSAGAVGVSGSTGRPLFEISWAKSEVEEPLWIVCAGQDVNGDGLTDFVMSDASEFQVGKGSFYLCSGSDGAKLGRIPPD